jgi:hypothetical protein
MGGPFLHCRASKNCAFCQFDRIKVTGCEKKIDLLLIETFEMGFNPNENGSPFPGGF